ncbi:MAG: MBL fold metallo-hydrolase [Desulfurococcales archaeon]|nr:MBL fold metallo-hydrolase [Desulfurococcales archaeon]
MGQGESYPGIHIVDTWPYVEGVVSAYIIEYGDGKAAIVDPGPVSGYERLSSKLESLGLKPEFVVVTHIHIDHAGSASLILRDHPGCKLYVHPRGARHMVDPSRLWEASRSVLGEVAEMYGQPKPAPAERVVEAADGLVLDLGGERRLRVIHTPGHASHHMSILLEPDGILFTGDSAGVILRVGSEFVHLPTTPPPLKPRLYLDSVEKMLNANPRILAPTHYGMHEGAPSLLRTHAEQIRLWLNTIKESMESGRDDIEYIASRIAERDRNAALVKGTGTYAEKAFIYNTLNGMIDAVRRGEW